MFSPNAVKNMLVQESPSIFVPFKDHGLAMVISIPERSAEALPTTCGSKKIALSVLVFLFKEVIDLSNQ